MELRLRSDLQFFLSNYYYTITINSNRFPIAIPRVPIARFTININSKSRFCKKNINYNKNSVCDRKHKLLQQSNKINNIKQNKSFKLEWHWNDTKIRKISYKIYD